jgi:hypothetical protein
MLWYVQGCDALRPFGLNATNDNIIANHSKQRKITANANN